MCISQYNKETSTYHRRSYCPRAISGRPPLDVILGCTQFTPLQPISLRSILMPFFYLIPCVPSNYSTVTLWSFVISLCATYLFNPPLLPQLSVVYFFLTLILITISLSIFQIVFPPKFCKNFFSLPAHITCLINCNFLNLPQPVLTQDPFSSFSVFHTVSPPNLFMNFMFLPVWGICPAHNDCLVCRSLL